MPEENLLGQENQGFYLIMANFQWERLLMALGAVGVDARDARARDRVRGERRRRRRRARHTRRRAGDARRGRRALTYDALRRFATARTPSAR